MNSPVQDPVQKENTNYPKVSIVIVNWNSYEDTLDCIESISNIKYENHEIIIVDNGSTDCSGEQLEHDFEHINVIFNETNRGFSGGVNTGLEQAIEAGSDYALILNNDTIVESDFLRPLVETAEQHTRVGIVTGILRFHESGEVQSAGRSFHKKFVKSPHWNDICSDCPYETECVSGALALFSTAFLEECGLLDESYFFAMEDVEISWRARINSWKLMVAPESVVYHKGGVTSTDTPFTWYHRIYGRLQFASDYLARSEISFFYFFLIFKIGRNMINWVINGHIDVIWSVLKAGVDFTTGKDAQANPNW